MIYTVQFLLTYSVSRPHPHLLHPDHVPGRLLPQKVVQLGLHLAQFLLLLGELAAFVAVKRPSVV